jgi:hypothetical protein
MVHDVKTRRSTQIVDRPEIEQHRITTGLERFETRAEFGWNDALDNGIVDRRA